MTSLDDLLLDYGRRTFASDPPPPTPDLTRMAAARRALTPRELAALTVLPLVLVGLLVLAVAAHRDDRSQRPIGVGPSPSPSSTAEAIAGCGKAASVFGKGGSQVVQAVLSYGRDVSSWLEQRDGGLPTVGTYAPDRIVDVCLLSGDFGRTMSPILPNAGAPSHANYTAALILVVKTATPLQVRQFGYLDTIDRSQPIAADSTTRPNPLTLSVMAPTDQVPTTSITGTFAQDSSCLQFLQYGTLTRYRPIWPVGATLSTDKQSIALGATTVKLGIVTTLTGVELPATTPEALECGPLRPGEKVLAVSTVEVAKNPFRRTTKSP